jgi:L-threonylcarbamoyladenylate synthase
LAEIGNDIIKAIELLKNGDLVGIPTETVYGLAANALNDTAVSKIFKAKNRPNFDPLIVHLFDIEQAKEYVTELPEEFEILAKHFSPGPITYLLPKKNSIPDLVTSGLDRVGIRIPNHDLTLELLKKSGLPLAAPSANPFGYISPTSAKHVNDQLSDLIPYILDGGDCQIGIESTIVGLENNEIVVYRKGGLKISDIENLIGKVKVNTHSSSNPQAPGMLKSHYAPKKNVVLIESEKDILDNNNSAFLGFDLALSNFPIENQYLLSPKGDYQEAARNLFSYLRKLDELNIETIYIKLLPEIDLGIAINDRLRRSAALG